MKDLYENPVTTTSAKTVDAINRFSNSLIGYGTDFGIIFEASDEDPDCAVAASLAGVLALFMETPDRLPLARKFYDRAAQGVTKATDREQVFVGALLAAYRGDLETALKGHRQLATEYPRDLLSAKIGQTLYFNIGDDEGMLWLADQIMDAHHDTAYAYGMRAFGLEQMSRFEEAEQSARRATEMQRKEPWAHHAVAHVMLTQGRHEEGIQWMQDLSNEWAACNSFMYTHNWWHLALFHLEQENIEEALKLYDTHVWGRDKSYSQDQINAISLLWRMEIAGFDVGDRWKDLADHIEARYLFNDQPFLDMQYMYALAREKRGEAVQKLLDGMAAMQTAAPSMTQACWKTVALPAAKSFIAYADGNYAKCLELLAPARDNLQTIGGSHAQRDLFQQVWIDSLLKAGRTEEAIALLQDRLDFRRPVPLDVAWMKSASAAA
ncbi:tetratricopeptide repeat protein [Sneathiella limimaris]|uniref:tetratricopeptide repeat protein n=1 Tax=Sneathiella limimaris TaxID=1964213 RepID=UPI00146EB1C1|nr:tetratricopeptide repeat protein [Sneathiella limimaris]